MQEQLSDLQLKLSKEEEERTSVAKLNKELDKVTHLYSSQIIAPCTIFTSTFKPLHWLFSILTLT